MSRSMGFMADAARFEDMDRAALHNALLALHTCPKCRLDLLPVANSADVWGCKDCRETWHVPTDGSEAPK